MQEKDNRTKYSSKNFIIYLLEHHKCCQHANQDVGCLPPSVQLFTEITPQMVQTPQNLILCPPQSYSFRFSFTAFITCSTPSCKEQVPSLLRFPFTAKSKSCQESSWSARHSCYPFLPHGLSGENSQLSKPEQATNCPNCSQQD